MIDCTIFDNLKPDEDKLISSGFAYDKSAGTYTASVPVSGGDFTFIFCVSKDGTISTDLIDADTKEPYLPYKVKDAAGAFIGSLNEECQQIAQSIADKCFLKPGEGDQLEQISAYMLAKYSSVPEHLWPDKYPDYAVWRRIDNDKWIGIVMQVPASKLSIDSGRTLQILDLHATADTVASVDSKTVFPAYHMNKKHWITLILDGRMTTEKIQEYIDASYKLAAK